MNEFTPKLGRYRWIVQIIKRDGRSSVVAWLATDKRVYVTRGLYSTEFSAAVGGHTRDDFPELAEAMTWCERIL